MATDADKITKTRFAEWRSGLREHNATPLLVLGLTSEKELIIMTCEGIEVPLMVEAASALLRGGLTAKG